MTTQATNGDVIRVVYDDEKGGSHWFTITEYLEPKAEETHRIKVPGHPPAWKYCIISVRLDRIIQENHYHNGKVTYSAVEEIHLE